MKIVKKKTVKSTSETKGTQEDVDSSEFGRCKFGQYCKYRHIKLTKASEFEMVKIKDDLENLKEQAKIKDNEIAAIEEEVSAFK